MKEPIKFTSRRERNLWMAALLVLVAIFTTLFLGGKLVNLLVKRHLLEQGAFVLFLLLLLIFMVSGWKRSRKKLEYWMYAGVIIVYGMVFIRLDISTSVRSHMFEYGILSILIYKALIERYRNGLNVKTPILTSILVAGTLGIMDECIQYFIPYRVFDIADIGFNFFASAFAVYTSFGVSKLKSFISN